METGTPASRRRRVNRSTAVGSAPAGSRAAMSGRGWPPELPAATPPGPSLVPFTTPRVSSCRSAHERPGCEQAGAAMEFKPTRPPRGRLVRLGVVLDTRNAWGRLLEIARMCEGAGIDALWVRDHLAHTDGE